MTSPAISKSPEKQKSDNKSPSHESNAEQAPPTEPTASTSDPQPSDPFSWLRIFKLADLMMKQGC